MFQGLGVPLCSTCIEEGGGDGNYTNMFLPFMVITLSLCSFSRRHNQFLLDVWEYSTPGLGRQVPLYWSSLLRVLPRYTGWEWECDPVARDRSDLSLHHQS